jgi:hypothetical protein
MVANFHPLLVLLLLFLKPNVANLLTACGASTWMLFIWILLSAAVLPLVAFDMPSFWWTGALGTIGHLILRRCPQIASFRCYVSFGLPLVPLHGVSIVTAIPSFLGLPLASISSITPKSKIVAAPTKHQSSNGLVESHWKVMVHMACAYLTEKQMPQTFWFYAITHAAQMTNAILVKLHGRLTSPFLLLVHGVGHNKCTWVLLLSSRKGRRPTTIA